MAQGKTSKTGVIVIIVGIYALLINCVGCDAYSHFFGPEASARKQATTFCETKFWKVESWSQRSGMGDPQQLIVKLVPAKYVRISGKQYFDKKGIFHAVDNLEYVFDASEVKEANFTKEHPNWYKLSGIIEPGAIIQFWCLTPEKKEVRGNWTNYLSPLSMYISKSEE